MYAGQHPPEPTGTVRGEQPQSLLVSARAELLQRLTEGLAPEHPALTVVEHAEAGVDPGREGVRLQEAVAEAVDGRDPGGVELAGQIVALQLTQPAPNSSA